MTKQWRIEQRTVILILVLILILMSGCKQIVTYERCKKYYVECRPGYCEKCPDCKPCETPEPCICSEFASEITLQNYRISPENPNIAVVETTTVFPKEWIVFPQPVTGFSFPRYSFEMAGLSCQDTTNCKYQLLDLRDFGDRGDEVTAIAYSADGQTIAFAMNSYDDGDYSIVLRGDDENEEKEFLADNLILAVAVSPDGRRLAAGLATYGQVMIWDINTEKLIEDLPDQSDFGDPVGRIVFSPDSSTVAYEIDNEEKVIWWDLTNAAKIGEFDGRILGFSPDWHSLVVDAGNNLVNWYDSNIEDKLLCSFDKLQCVTDNRTIAISPDGRTFACLHEHDKIELRDATTNSYKYLQIDDLSDNDNVNILAFSPDGRLLIAGLDNGDIVVWGVAQE